MCRCLTTSSSSVSPNRAPTRWSRPRGTSFTSTDHAHPSLHGSALPHDGGGARGEVAQTGRGRREGRRHARRGGDGQGGHGSGGARRRRAAAGRRGRGADGAGGERRGGDRGAGRGGRGAKPPPGAGAALGRRDAGGGRRGPPGGAGAGGHSDRGERDGPREGFTPRQAHREGGRGRPE